MKNSLTSVVLLLIILVSSVAACLWDTDTLSEEMSESPSAIELVTGGFPRHSEDFYRWRIENRKARLEAGENNPLLYDDIAVAYDKLHQQEQAIEWMVEKEKKYPGKYETYANLGTFYIHSGNFPEGILNIEKALEINPEAHFNREQYQLYVVKYLQHRAEHGQFKEGRLLLPLSRDAFVEQRNFNRKNHGRVDVELHDIPEPGINSFYIFIANDLADKTTEDYNPRYVQMTDEQTAAAVQGILGMMRFGHHDSPVLLECLADLLVPRTGHGVGNRIAARALLKASYEVEDSTARDMYYEMACQAIAGQEGVKIAPLELALKRELKQANQYYEELTRLENKWIASGADVEAEFRKKYYKQTGEGETLAFFPIDFERVVKTKPRPKNLLQYSIFVTLASIVLGISITAHLLPKIIAKLRMKSDSVS